MLAEARIELASKSLKQIELETAFKWAARALAAYELWVGGDRAMFHDAVTYLGEALEHAVFADETGATVQAIRDWVHQYVPRGILG